jgi:hypothetical protein
VISSFREVACVITRDGLTDGLGWALSRWTSAAGAMWVNAPVELASQSLVELSPDCSNCCEAFTPLSGAQLDPSQGTGAWALKELWWQGCIGTALPLHRWIRESAIRLLWPWPSRTL